MSGIACSNIEMLSLRRMTFFTTKEMKNCRRNWAWKKRRHRRRSSRRRRRLTERGRRIRRKVGGDQDADYIA